MGPFRLRVLILEDSPNDADLAIHQLRESGFELDWHRVDTETDFLAGLRETPDIILADYSLPQFDALRALCLLQAQGVDIPLVLVSGTIGEEVAVEAMKAGARDYIMKSNLVRLGPAVVREVHEARERRRSLMRQTAQISVSRALAESFTLGEAAPRLLEAVCDSLGWEIGEIWMLDAKAHVLRCEAIWHVPSLDASEFAKLGRALTVASGFDLPGRVWAKGDPVWIADILTDANFVRVSAAARLGLHGAVAFPILDGKECIGVVQLFSLKVQHADVDLSQMMADIGIKIGQFVHRQRIHEQFRQAQKMEAIGQLAGGIAHDFNNLLTVISGYSDILSSRLPLDDPSRGEVEQIEQAARRAATLTRQLLAFSRRQVITPIVLDINGVVSGIEKLLRRLIGADIVFTTNLDAELGCVRADAGQIEQVIMNLAVNARDAMPQGGRLTIQTANIQLDDTSAPLHTAVQPGSYVKLSVSDTGCGMDVETQSKIFEPFFTTKEAGKGTGLGLATVYGIVKQSGGTIWVSSEVGKGTTFHIYLPRLDGTAEYMRPVTLPSNAPTGTETILYVEDDEMVRILGRRILQRNGYTVLEARNGDQALDLCREHAGPIHLLLTDMVLPGMSGRALSERVALSRVDTKVLYISGYSEDAIVQHNLPAPADMFLHKPFTADMLARRVRDILDMSAPGIS
jgi:signal transduction histidine kinase/DNA-binding response OmpR family regulator